MSSGQRAPQLVDMPHPPGLPRGVDTVTDFCVILFHNLIQLIIYIIFKYLRKDLFSRNCPPHLISGLSTGERCFPRAFQGGWPEAVVSTWESALRARPHSVTILAG